MYNKIYILVSIGLIVIGLLMPKYFEHKKIYGRILETKLLEKVEEIPVKRVKINKDNVTETVNTYKNFTRYRLYIRYQYYMNNKRYIGEHKFGDYPGYLTELELVNVKRRFFKSASIPIFVNIYNDDRSRLLPPTNYPRIYFTSAGFILIYAQIIYGLLKVREGMINSGELVKK